MTKIASSSSIQTQDRRNKVLSMSNVHNDNVDTMFVAVAEATWQRSGVQPLDNLWINRALHLMHQIAGKVLEDVLGILCDYCLCHVELLIVSFASEMGGVNVNLFIYEKKMEETKIKHYAVSEVYWCFQKITYSRARHF